MKAFCFALAAALMLTACGGGGSGKISGAGASTRSRDIGRRSRTRTASDSNNPDVRLPGLVGEIRIDGVVRAAAGGGRNVHQASGRIERHGRPVVRTAGSRRQRNGVCAIVRFGVHDGLFRAVEKDGRVQHCQKQRIDAEFFPSSICDR